MTPSAGIQSRSDPGYRSDIQGLRAVAVMLVLLCHAGVGFLEGGYVGVDVFFVISGFLITGVLLAGVRRRGQVSLPDFYARRARRILPAATLTIVATSFVSFHVFNFVRAKEYLIDALYSGAFTANIRFAELGADYFAQTQPPSPFRQFWTLAVEEQFYLVWPVLFALFAGIAIFGRTTGKSVVPKLRRLTLGLVLLTSLSLGWSIHTTSASPETAYFSTFARAWELGLGALLACCVPVLARVPRGFRVVLGWIGAGAIICAAVAFDARTAFPGYAALVPTVGAAMVIAAGVGSRPHVGTVGRLLSLRPVRYVGDLSYALYLWHWPVLIIAAHEAGGDLSLGESLGLLLVAFALSVVSYHSFENPLRRGTWRPPPTWAWLWAGAGALAVIAFVQTEGIQTSLLQKGAIALVSLGLCGALRLFVSHNTDDGPVKNGAVNLTAAGVAVAAVALIALGDRVSLLLAITVTFAAAVAGALAARLSAKHRIPSLAWQRPPAALVMWPLSLIAVCGVASYYLVRISDLEQASAAGAPAPASVLVDRPGTKPLPAVSTAVDAVRSDSPVPLQVRPPLGELVDDRYSFPAGCVAGTGQTSSDICRLGDTSSRETVVVLGDSKAHMWMPAILAMAQTRGWAVIPLVKSSCTPHGWGSDAPDSECQTWKRWAMSQAQEARPSLLIVSGHYEPFEVYPAFSEVSLRGLSGVLERTVPAARRSLVIADIPGLGHQPVDCLLEADATMRACATRITDYQLAVNQRVRRLAHESGAAFVETEGWFCARGVCPPAVGNTLTYSDHGHVTLTYARDLRKVFAGAVRAALRRNRDTGG